MCQPPPLLLSRAHREAMMAQAVPLVKSHVRKHAPYHLFDDICQDVMLEVWKAIDRFDPAKAAWPTYVVGIAKILLRKRNSEAFSCPVNEAFGTDPLRVGPTMYEKLAEQLPAGGTEPEEEPDAEQAMADDVSRAVRAATTEPLLAALTPSGRAAVEPIVRDGVTPDQAAERAGMSVKDVKLHIRNAARRLACRFDAAGTAIGYKKPRKPAKASKPPTRQRSAKCERLEPLAIAALNDVGPCIDRIAKRIGVNAGALAGWRKFRAAYDAVKGVYHSSESFQRERAAIALLAEVGPNASAIAKRLGVGSGTPLRWPEFRRAYDAAKAAEAAKEEPPPPVASPPSPPARAFSGRGWHFAKRLAPWTAKKLFARRR